MSISKKFKLTAEAIAEQIGAKVIGDGSVEISSVNSLSNAGSDEMTFITNQVLAEKASESNAGAFLVEEAIATIDKCQLVVSNANAALIEVLNIFAPKLKLQQGVHPTAIIEESAELGENVSVGPYAVISHDVKVGANTQIGAGSHIGEGSCIGQNTILDRNVVIYHNCMIGNNCIIQSNTVIGACGFGYSLIDGTPKLVPHNGGVIIEDCVEIGANTCVDRAKFGNTVIGAGSKIDNHVMIAHNVTIGKCCLIAAQSGFAGSVRIGNGVVCGGRVGIVDHRTVGDGCQLGVGTLVLEDWPAGSQILGFPAERAKEKLRQFVLFKRLPKIADQVKDLVRRVSSLEASKNDKK